MFWIMGGENIIHASAKLLGWPALIWASSQLEHVDWNGFRFYDMVFPLFLFLAGVSMPFSILRRKEQGESSRTLYLHLFKRCGVLIFLGIVFNFLPDLDLTHMRYASVLARIGLGWFFASLIVLNFSILSQAIWFAGILCFYWALLCFVPVPGVGAGVLTLDGNLAGYIDRLFLPGILYDKVMDPEGILSTIPAVATALMGAMAGHCLRAKKTFLWLTVVGLAAIGLGWLWNAGFPVNKKLWTSSYVLVAGGWSLILLSLFYLVIDVWKFRRLAFFFTVIGVNSITIYLGGQAACHLPEFHIGSGAVEPLLHSVTWVVMAWTVLYILFRRGIFLRV